MENFNKLISFILGLVVVIVFLLIISGKIDLRKKLITKKTTTIIENNSLTLTPTPIIKKTITEVSLTTQTNKYQEQSTKKTTVDKPFTKEIPATGSPTIFIPFVFSTLSLGFLINKKIKSS